MLWIGHFVAISTRPFHTKSPSYKVADYPKQVTEEKHAPDVPSPVMAFLSHPDSSDPIPLLWGRYLWPSPTGPESRPSAQTPATPLQWIQTDSHTTALHHVDKVIKEQINWAHTRSSRGFQPGLFKGWVKNIWRDILTPSKVPGWLISDLSFYHLHNRPIWARNSFEPGTHHR